MHGKFITFEGGEGAGKSTQATALARKLSAFGIASLPTREPGGSPGAEIIRHVLLSGLAKGLGGEAEAVLFAAARADHLAPSSCRRWRPVHGWCATGFSTPPGFTRACSAMSAGRCCGRWSGSRSGTRCRISPSCSTCRQNSASRGHANGAGPTPPIDLKRKILPTMSTLNSAFRDLAAAQSARCVLVDATPPADQIAAEIWRHVRKRLRPKSAPMSLEKFAW